MIVHETIHMVYETIHTEQWYGAFDNSSGYFSTLYGVYMERLLTSLVHTHGRKANNVVLNNGFVRKLCMQSVQRTRRTIG